jgi:hypothetical protein
MEEDTDEEEFDGDSNYEMEDDERGRDHSRPGSTCHGDSAANGKQTTNLVDGLSFEISPSIFQGGLTNWLDEYEQSTRNFQENSGTVDTNAHPSMGAVEASATGDNSLCSMLPLPTLTLPDIDTSTTEPAPLPSGSHFDGLDFAMLDADGYSTPSLV